MLRRIKNFFSSRSTESSSKPRNSQKGRKTSRSSNNLRESGIHVNSYRKSSKTRKTKRLSLSYNGARPLLLAGPKNGRVKKRILKRKKVSRDLIVQAMDTVNMRGSAQKHVAVKKMRIEDTSKVEDEFQDEVTERNGSRYLSNRNSKSSNQPARLKSRRIAKRIRSRKKLSLDSIDKSLSTVSMTKRKNVHRHTFKEARGDKGQFEEVRTGYSGPKYSNTTNNYETTHNSIKSCERNSRREKPSFFTRLKENLFGRSQHVDNQERQTTVPDATPTERGSNVNWPHNPLARIAAIVRCLPRNYLIVEFGCGGRLAREVPHRVFAMQELCRPKFRAESMHVAVFCLSLMGTCLRDCMLEVNRFLKFGGLVIIAEIRSRYDNLHLFLSGMRSCGFELLKKQHGGELFTYFEFQKVISVGKNATTEGIKFSLKPCMYRQR